MLFSEIIGQQELKAHLVRGIDSGRVSHAQLFTGAAGTGALPLALAYVQYLNCRHRHDGKACGECPDCRQITALAHPDLHFVLPVNKQGKKSGEAVLSDDFLPLFRQAMADTGGYLSPQEWYDRLELGKTLKGVISAREADAVIRKLSFKSFEAEYKCVIVWLPEAMNDEAANKLLKILEEPWEKTLFLLVSEHPERLLPTILSRTQEVAVPRLQPAEIIAELERRGERDPERLRSLPRLCGGDWIELQRILRGGGEDVRHENFELFCSLMRLSYNDKHLELTDWAEEVAALSREQQRAMLRDAVRLLRESYMLHAGMGAISTLWGEEATFCARFAPFIDNDNIEPLVEEIERAAAQIAQNGNPTIVFTHFALTVSKMIKKRA